MKNSIYTGTNDFNSPIDEDTGWWHEDTFEDYISKGLTSLYEGQNVAKKFIKSNRKGYRLLMDKHRICPVTSFNRLKENGIYFPSYDRYTDVGSIDIENDGLPNYACMAASVKREEGQIGGYLEIYTVEKINRFPKAVLMPLGAVVAKYRLNLFYAQNTGGLDAHSFYAVVRPSGEIVAEHGIEDSESIIGCVAASIGFYTDKRFIWNVDAIEKTARASFGVNKEQVKSLFFARDLPMTITGRKRPILHWVKSHKRRIKEGIDIDINKYLRGITEFEFNGTLFKITNPIK